jgi:D-alanyl-D-alanine dipeptidase
MLKRLLLVSMLFLLDYAGRAAEAAAPPEGPGPFRKGEWVELKDLDPTLRLDVRYATSNNFLGRKIYPEARVFLQKEAAEAVIRAHRKLRGRGYGLMIFDGYRPWSVTKLFWDETPESKRPFLADPKEGSRHNRGCAVDLTLFDLKTGRELAMPSEYDEMTERAYPDYAGGPETPRRLRDLLRAAMEAEGFTVYPTEWWHFDYKDWQEYAILDVPLAEMDRLRQR